MKRVLAVAFLMLLVAQSASAEAFSKTKFTKQNGGSTGDSLTVLPDTSAVRQLGKDWEDIFVISVADTNCTRAIQVCETADGTFATVVFDTLVTPSGSAATVARSRATADLEAYAGFYVRVILDNLSAAGKTLGATYVNWAK